MNSIATGTIPAPTIAATQRPAASRVVEAEQHRARALGGAQDSHRRLGDDAELAFGTDDEAEQIEPGGVEMRAAEIDDRRRRRVTSRTPRTLLVVTPYFRQCAPPEFIPILPPIVQASCEDGSGA